MTGGALLLAAALTTACSPEPAPTPTPTGFASEEEAFEAAEATYRAYVDALNEVDLSDPVTFEPVFATLAGDALASEKKSLSTMHADGFTVEGDTTVARVEPAAVDSSTGQVSVRLCLDVTNVRVKDASGEVVRSEGRPDQQPLNVTFVRAQTDTGLLIASSQVSADIACG